MQNFLPLNSDKKNIICLFSPLPSVVACPEPVTPNATLNLVSKLPYNISTDPVIPFSTKWDYVCRDGMKFEKDLDLKFETAICAADNIWEEPNGKWSPCVPSK